MGKEAFLPDEPQTTEQQTKPDPVVALFINYGNTLPPLQAHEQIYDDTSNADAMYYVLKGRIALQRNRERIEEEGRKRKARTATVGLAGPGDIIGLDALTGTPYSSTAVTEVPSEIIALPTDTLIPLLKESPDAAIQMAAILAQEIHRTNNHGHTLKFGDARRKAAFATQLYSNHADEQGMIPVTQEQLAYAAGISRETVVNDTGKFLTRKGATTRPFNAPGVMRVRDPKTLKGIAESR